VGGAPLTLEQRQMVFRLRGKGFSWEKIARAAGCSLSGAYTYSRTPRQARPAAWTPRPGRLTIADREEILVGLAKGETLTAIAHRIGRAVSTVSREVAANGGRRDYRAWGGHVRAQERTRRPKPARWPLTQRSWPRSSKALSSSGPPTRSPGACVSSIRTIR
jgi:IS30 family transposase